MNVANLKDRLNAENVDPGAYSLIGGEVPWSWAGQPCFEVAIDGFRVFYAERGERGGERVFTNEEEACDYFFEWVLENPECRRKTPMQLLLHRFMLTSRLHGWWHRLFPRW